MPVRKPIEQHIIDGTHRPSRHGDKGFSDEMAHPSIPPPKRMHPEAQKVWRELLPLMQKGQIMQTDLLAFEILCNAWADYHYCVNKIVADGYVTTYTNTEGATNTMRHPLSTDKKQAYDMLQQMLGRFGLTPSDRAKVVIAMRDDEEDEMADFV